jgi:hypothetical protein
MRETIHVARLAVLNLPFRAEQLRAIESLHQAFAAATNDLRRQWGCLTVVIAFPAIVGALATPYILKTDRFRGDLRWIAAFVGVFLLQVGLGGLGRWRRRRRLRALRAELDVRPTRPEILTCRLCGAPLDAESLDEPVVACGHCHGENILDAETAADWARREVEGFNARAASVEAKAARALSREGVWLPIELYVPFVLFALLVIDLIRHC